ncbi:hypothetical protein ZIOFF_013656 [Zingiber officinale]|uniref:dUTP diphosphatase n=1 Tax=Zingiber officinale TaxID=94328 RepID=A0A8J5LNZ2_ZINOF|nr:hypothetical protein ZIOFF_013656 [Zingiber officinale]
MMTTRSNTDQHQVSSTPLFEDQIREYRRNQRRLHNTKQAARRISRRLTGSIARSHTLEQQIDPQAQLQLSMQERASLVPTEVLYHSRRDDANHRVYVHRSEEDVLVADGNQADRSFIQESFNQLQRSNMQYIHLGILQVRIQILHRQREGTMALIVFRDNRWQGDQAILATMEVDLTQGSQMVYVIPEIMLTIGDFFRNIQISILIRGYEAWQNGEANLLITRGLVGRLSNTFNVGFAYKIQGVVNYLTTYGVKALPGRSLSTQKLQGLNSVIKPTQVIILMQPSEVNSNNLMDGRISLSFNNYIAAQSATQAIYTKRDEELQSQNDKIIEVLIERENDIFEEVDILTNPDREETDYPYLLVHKLSSNAIIPTRQSTGAAGLDLATSEDCVIPPRGRGLIPTGISMEISWGTYGRIAARSSAAYRLGLDIGTGVIDCDYRGEVKIIAFNHSDQII